MIDDPLTGKQYNQLLIYLFLENPEKAHEIESIFSEKMGYLTYYDISYIMSKKSILIDFFKSKLDRRRNIEVTDEGQIIQNVYEQNEQIYVYEAGLKKDIQLFDDSFLEGTSKFSLHKIIRDSHDETVL